VGVGLVFWGWNGGFMSNKLSFEYLYKGKEPEHLCVVRLSTERFNRGDSYFTGKSLRVMKRLSRGYNMLKEEVDLLGVYDFFSDIESDMNKLPDGLYVLDYSSFWTDWETGHSEADGYKLKPYPSD
jgi:hypothetical protein